MYVAFVQCTSMELILSIPTAPLALKFGINQGKAGRKDMREGRRKKEGVWGGKNLSS
jgi:hypothetical protein